MFTSNPRVSRIKPAPVRALTRRRAALAAFVALITAPIGATAQQVVNCDPLVLPLPEGCEHPNAGRTVSVPAGANTETVAGAPAGGFAQTGFSISLDNQVIAGAPPPFNPDRSADIALARAGVDVRYDGLDSRRLLNVSTVDQRASYPAGERIVFRASSNYPAYIARAEIRILDLARRAKPVVATIATMPNGTAGWVMPAEGEGRFAYVLRVYDLRGRYDETLPLTLTRSDTRFGSHANVGGPLLIAAAGEGEDRTRVRRIPVRGGVITTSGHGATPGGTVTVMGEEVPVDGSGRFVVSRVLPAGDHVVSVNINGRTLVRDVNIPSSEWFHVGIADVTAGYRWGGSAGEEGTYVDGRAAFYVTGKTESGWSITSSLDTGDGPISDIFSRLNDKDPRRVLDRLRGSDDMYPTYGDNSTWYDDTPTSGAIYLRAQNETTRFTWGNFDGGVSSPGLLLNNSRDLYGAELRYQSASITANGDARLTASLYAAQPETLPQRDILRGTGGSVYFLSRQDITGGSASVMIQLVDPDTGYVSSTTTLVEGVDFTIDHMQGVLILANPVASSGGSGGLIGDGGGALDLNLVVQYEYTPSSFDVDSTVFGGRAEVWATDNLRIGATGMQETTAAGEQQMLGADLRYRFGQQSYAQLEVARTSGPGLGRSVSTDGGLTIISSGGAVAGEAIGLSFDSHFDLKELGFSTPGHLNLYYESKEAGFSTLAEDITSDQTLMGVEAEVKLSQRLSFGLEAERFSRASGDEHLKVGASLSYRLNDVWTIAAAAEQLDKTTVGDPAQTGARTDLGLRLTYAPHDDLSVYAFGQATASLSGGLSRNNRFGLGVDAQLSEKLSLAAEASAGDSGTAGMVRLSYAPTENNEIYLGYTLDPTRSGAGSALSDAGTVVLGGRYRYSENLSTYAESILDMPGSSQSLTQAYGVSYTPNEQWTLAGSFETGEVRDDVSGNFNRTAVSLGAAYAPGEDSSARVRLEYRTEDGVGAARDRDTWALSAGYANAFNENWRFLADLEALYSTSAEGDFRDGEYARASLGFAYRPVDNERLNLLFRYSFLHDLPGEDQVGSDGSSDGPLQRSHVLSVNGNYDLTQELTLGAKLGYRMSEIAPRGTSAFTSNTAALAVARLDWHVVHEWDIFGEGRMLWTPETGTSELGAVVGIYRHLGDRAKIGLGYEWGGVSDDLTDINYQSQGVFLNIVGKF